MTLTATPAKTGHTVTSLCSHHRRNQSQSSDQFPLAVQTKSRFIVEDYEYYDSNPVSIQRLARFLEMVSCL